MKLFTKSTSRLVGNSQAALLSTGRATSLSDKCSPFSSVGGQENTGIVQHQERGTVLNIFDCAADQPNIQA